jgi:hypothetical protein
MKTGLWPTLCGLALCGAASGLSAAALPTLDSPAKIMAGNQPIAVEIGHAMPFVVDFNRDGKKDLLVGQFGGGKCRVYLNQGTDAEPKFGDYTWLKAAREVATVPPS